MRTETQGDSMASSVRPVVDAFYAALQAGQVDALAELIERNFAPDAVLWRPDSLPGGGRTEGPEKIRQFFAAAASGGGLSSLKASRVIESVVDGTADVIVELTVLLGGFPVHAVEWWTGSGGQITELRAYYWDTAGMLGPS